MTEHTTGPWFAENLDDEPYGRITIHAKTGRSIATLWQDDAPVHEWNAEQWANARLIAAAPEMVAALRVMLELVRNIGDERGYPVEAGALDMARSAIERAEGRKP